MYTYMYISTYENLICVFALKFITKFYLLLRLHSSDGGC